MKLPSTKIIHLDVAPNRRIIALSDVHGCVSHLKNGLKKAGFCKDDLLIIVGDIVEKGPDSLETLRYVMELCEGGNVIPLIGNVDAYRLKVINELCPNNAAALYDYVLVMRDRNGSCLYDDMAKECGIALNSQADVLNAREPILSRFERELSFLAELPTVLDTSGFTFVHGGLRDKRVEDNAQRGVFELTKYDDFATLTPHVFEKYVVVGHWPVSLYDDSIQQLDPVIHRHKRIISIDGGCGVKHYCQMNLLVIPSVDCSIDEVYNVRYDDLPKLRTLDDQAPSDDPINIYWTRRQIKLLEKGEEFSYVQHEYSGRRLLMPNSYLRSDTDCRDYTDYSLPVAAGDELSLITETSKGIIAKKNGTVGWYYGRYEKI